MGTDAFRVLSRQEEWSVAFAPPRFASSRLWIANIAGLEEYDLQSVLLRFGLSQLSMRLSQKCAYADFSSVERAVEARNHLFGVETPTGQRLNLDFCDTGRKRYRVDDPPVTVVDEPRLADASKRRRVDRDERRVVSRYEERVVKERDVKERDVKERDVKEERREVLHCTLFKLEDRCCDVVASLVSGSEELRMPSEVRIDQRTRREHCKTHMGRSRFASIWHLRAETRRDCTGFDELCDYLVDKDRVGIARTANGYVYIVPPVREFLDTFGLRDTKNLVAIQVEGTR